MRRRLLSATAVRTISHISGVMTTAAVRPRIANVVITISLPRGEKAANDA